MKNLIIRKAKLIDIPEVVDIQITGWQEAYKGIIDDDYLESLNLEREKRIKKLENNYSNGNFIVAELDNEIVGFCRYVNSNEFSKEVKNADCELTVLYVKPSLKNNGIGSALFKHVINEMNDLNKNLMILWCFKDNTLSIKFYEKMGGIIISEKTKVIGNEEKVEVCFSYNIKELVMNDKLKTK